MTEKFFHKLFMPIKRKKTVCVYVCARVCVHACVCVRVRVCVCTSLYQYLFPYLYVENSVYTALNLFLHQRVLHSSVCLFVTSLAVRNLALIILNIFTLILPSPFM